MKYISVKSASEKWNISDRRVRTLCQQGRIEGAIREEKLWKIPADAPKPIDGRLLRNKKLNTEFANLFIKIDRKKEELNKKRPLTSGETKRLYEEFCIEFTYNSNAIEGNTLTLQETALVLSEGVTIAQKPLKEHLEVIGHRDAFIYIQKLVTDKVKLSERVIKDIHSLVLMDKSEDRGVYRKVPVRIMGALNEPPQPYLIIPQMEQLLVDYDDMAKNMHTIEKVALFHLKFEGIHPFIDGNGRTGRLILNFDLMQNGYPPIDIKFIDRIKYYEAFNAFYGDDNISNMVKLIAGYVEERLDNYLEILS